METRELTCISCPLGCSLTITLDNNNVISVSGNTCPRGESYGRKECTDPTRIVTSTVRVIGGKLPVVSVKTQTDIPKDKIFDIMNALKNTVIHTPVHIGDIVLKDAAGTGVNVIATKNII